MHHRQQLSGPTGGHSVAGFVHFAELFEGWGVNHDHRQGIQAFGFVEGGNRDVGFVSGGRDSPFAKMPDSFEFA